MVSTNFPPSPTSTAHSSLSGGHSGSSQSPSPMPPPTPISPTVASHMQSQQSTPTPLGTGAGVPAAAAMAGGAGPEKRKPSRRANTAERRATHNAVERQRRETLNGRFMDLASLLPNLASVRRPSKSAIVNSSIALIHQQRRQRFIAARELRGLYAQFLAVKAECEEWRMRAGVMGLGVGMGMGRIEEGERTRDFVELLGMQIPDNLDEISDEERTALRAVEGPGMLGGLGDDDDDMDGDYGVGVPVVAAHVVSHGHPHGMYPTGLGMGMEEKAQREREQREREQQQQQAQMREREQREREQREREQQQAAAVAAAQQQAQAQAVAAAQQQQQQQQQRGRSSTFSGTVRVQTGPAGQSSHPTTPTYDALHHPTQQQASGYPHSPAELFPLPSSLSVPSTNGPSVGVASVGEVYNTLAETYAGIFGTAPHQGPPAPGTFVHAQQAFGGLAPHVVGVHAHSGGGLEMMFKEFHPHSHSHSHHHHPSVSVKTSSDLSLPDSPTTASATSTTAPSLVSAGGSKDGSVTSSPSVSTSSASLSGGSSSVDLTATANSPVEEEGKYSLVSPVEKKDSMDGGEGLTLSMPMYHAHHGHGHGHHVGGLSHGGYGYNTGLHAASLGHPMMTGHHGHHVHNAHAHSHWKSVSPVGSVGSGAGVYF